MGLFKKKLILLLIPLFLMTFQCGGSSGGTIKIAWDSNTEADLAGYKAYYGTASGDYFASVDMGMGAPYSNSETYFILTGLTKGQTYCIAVTAYDQYSNESNFSNEVCGLAH